MQRRDFSRQLVGAGLGLAVGSAARAQGGPVEGQHYTRLSTPATVTLSGPDKKIDIVEFFSYACPHCNAFEPTVEAWAKSLPADVAFRRLPIAFRPDWVPLQRLYFALEEMGQLPALHKKVFAAIHQQNRHLDKDGDIIAFVAANGVDGARFSDAYKSFSVNTKSTRAKQLAEAYKIDGVPALGIHGRFVTAASMAGSHEQAVAVANYLIQRARQKV